MNRWETVWREIELSTNTRQLRALRNEIHDTFGSAPSHSDEVRIVAAVNAFHDALIRKTLCIAEKRVWESYGAPPVSSFAFLLFGSGGRKEQTLWSDQDNGIVFEAKSGADRESVERYMAQIGEACLQALGEVGYPPCEGQVLGSNPKWRKSLDGWRAALEQWFDQPEFETVRYLLIMADARHIYGDEALAARLRSLYMSMLKDRRSLLPRMLQNTLRYKVLVGLLGNLLTEPYGEDAGGIDIKYGAYLPMVNAVRLLALDRGIEATSTLERIRELRENHRVPQEWTDGWESAFRTILSFRSMTPYRLEDGKYTTRGILPSQMLTKEVKRELKQALRRGAELQKLAKRTFDTGGPQ
jgi:CBS domain-containing protein